LCLQFSVAALYARARAATGQPVRPVRVAFAQSPPSHRRLAEGLGTRNVDFGAPITTFTFSARDLDLPMRGADPSLARILNRYAASLPAPPPVTWHGHFQRLLASSNAVRQRRAVKARQSGTVGTAALARQLAYSDPRSVRRALRRWDNEAIEVPTTS
jgi:hypothetical protein